MEKENKLTLDCVSSLQPHPTTEIAITVLLDRYRNKQKKIVKRNLTKQLKIETSFFSKESFFLLHLAKYSIKGRDTESVCAINFLTLESPYLK